MNGYDLERLLSRIDQNLKENEVILRSEIMRYLQVHEDAVVDQLWEAKKVRVPASFGNFNLDLADLRNNIFSPVAA